jgi:parallel beta-helix repeat protein
MRKVNPTIFVAVCVLIMTLVWPVGADIYTVNPGESIQAAIDAASNGDEIEVSPGTYNEAIAFKGKAVRLYSSGGPEVTTIDANGAYHVVLCISGEDANTILDGFTITGGNASGVDWPHFHGGGMLNIYSSPTVSNCTFTENSSVHWGGGMYNDRGSHTTLINCTFSGNISDTGGAGMGNYSSNPTVTNCIFTGNSADNGGGMLNVSNSSPTMTNCTFSGNTAGIKGGGMSNVGSSPTVTNCILWGDEPNEISNSSGSPTVTYSDVEGGTGQAWFGTGCIDADPCFVNTTAGNFHLLFGSPCIDAGTNSAPGLPATDFEGDTRIANVNVDMGADEYVGGPATFPSPADGAIIVSIDAQLSWTAGVWAISHDVWFGTDNPPVALLADDITDTNADPGPLEYGVTYYWQVDENTDAGTITGDVWSFRTEIWEIWVDDDYWDGGENDGHRWGIDAFDNIGAGIDMAGYGTTVHVAAGTYLENITLKNGVALIGAGASDAVIDAGGSGRVVFSNTCDANTILEGFTITGGNAYGSQPEEYNGGGMYNDSSSPTVNNCTFSGNSASTSGGGMYNFGGPERLLVGYDFENIAPNQGVDVPAPPSFVRDVLVTASDLGIVQGSDVDLITYPYENGVVTGPTQQISFWQGIPESTNVAPEGYNFFEFSVAAVSSPVGITSMSFSTGHNDADDKTSHEGIIEYRTPGGDLLGSDTFIIQYGLAGAPVSIVPSTTLVVGTQPTFFRIRFNEEIYGFNSYITQLRIDDLHLNTCKNETNSPTVTNCTFSGNSANSYGGGMYNTHNSSPTVTNCTFSGNSANSYGGGMYNYFYTSPTVTNCTFSGNSAEWGGGMYNQLNSNATVTNCVLSGNSAGEGGGMFNYNSSPTVTNCTFSGNSANSYGGGMLNYVCSPTVTNCTFSGNSANRDGGGMSNYLKSSPTLTNCTFNGNSANTLGGGMYNFVYSSPTVTNCIMWGDSAVTSGDEIYNDRSSPAVTYSDVQGGYGGVGNIDADPLFVDPNNPDPNLWSLRLKPDSPCIDAGDSTILLAVPIYFDLDGKDRYVDIGSIDDTGSGPWEFLDMGAYEFDCMAIAGDINCDGVVDFKDLAILCGNWLAVTEPE